MSRANESYIENYLQNSFAAAADLLVKRLSANRLLSAQEILEPTNYRRESIDISLSYVFFFLSISFTFFFFFFNRSLIERNNMDFAIFNSSSAICLSSV